MGFYSLFIPLYIKTSLSPELSFNEAILANFPTLSEKRSLVILKDSSSIMKKGLKTMTDGNSEQNTFCHHQMWPKVIYTKIYIYNLEYLCMMTIYVY